jgi:hypothetical protein
VIFSWANFGASLAGISRRDDLAREKVLIRRRDFGPVNLTIIIMAMVVGCAVLVGEACIL